jgi:hypothetical protein
MIGEHCGGVITETTTKEELLARGFTSLGADEVLKFREFLKRKGLTHPAVETSPTPPESV